MYIKVERVQDNGTLGKELKYEIDVKVKLRMTKKVVVQPWNMYHPPGTTSSIIDMHIYTNIET